MFRRFVLTVAIIGMTVSFAFSREVVVNIMKVEGSKVTFTEMKKGDKGGLEPDGDRVLSATRDVIVEKAPAGKKAAGKKAAPVPNDPIDGGLTNVMFKGIDAKGIRATMTIDDDGANKDKITKVIVGGAGAKGKKGG